MSAKRARNRVHFIFELHARKTLRASSFYNHVSTYEGVIPGTSVYTVFKHSRNTIYHLLLSFMESTFGLLLKGSFGLESNWITCLLQASDHVVGKC